MSKTKTVIEINYCVIQNISCLKNRITNTIVIIIYVIISERM